MRSTKHNSLLVTAALIAAGAGMAIAAPRRTPHRESYRPTPPKRNTELQREIADHNAAVEARKAEKRARKMGQDGGEGK